MRVRVHVFLTFPSSPVCPSSILHNSLERSEVGAQFENKGLLQLESYSKRDMDRNHSLVRINTILLLFYNYKADVSTSFYVQP